MRMGYTVSMRICCSISDRVARLALRVGLPAPGSVRLVRHRSMGIAPWGATYGYGDDAAIVLHTQRRTPKAFMDVVALHELVHASLPPDEVADHGPIFVGVLAEAAYAAWRFPRWLWRVLGLQGGQCALSVWCMVVGPFYNVMQETGRPENVT